MVRPDDERQKANHQHRENERFVTPERLARIVGQNFGDDSERGQDQYVNFRVTEKPEQVLPQKRTATAADVEWRAVDDHSGREEKAGRRGAIHQLHENRSLEWRKREQQ